MYGTEVGPWASREILLQHSPNARYTRVRGDFSVSTVPAFSLGVAEHSLRSGVPEPGDGT